MTTRGFDVAVVGAGIVGAATASELARRGARVCLLDRGEVSGGTTGLGEGNVLASDKDAGPELELTLHGLRMYDELEDRLGPLTRVRRKGALIVHPEPETWAAEPARVARLRAAGVRAELLTAEQAREREPGLTGAIHGASYFPADLQCAPRAITQALAASPGIEVRTGCEVHAVLVDRPAGGAAPVRDAAATSGGAAPVRDAAATSGGAAPARDAAGTSAASGRRVVGLDTAGGRIACDAVVLAAGVWTAPLAATAGLVLPLEPRKGQLVRLRVPDPEPRRIRHKVVDGSYLRSVASPAAGLQVTSVLETTWEGHVLVGSSRERRGFDTAVDPAVSRAMLDRAARLMPSLAALVPDSAWAGLRPWLPDGAPAIGPSAAAEGLWIATGHEGAGVALGPVTGRLIAQALCGEPPLVDLGPFDPDRFGRPTAAG